jgi:hypothetical protein
MIRRKARRFAEIVDQLAHNDTKRNKGKSNRTAEVRGSNPLGSTKNPKKSDTWFFPSAFRAFIARHDSANDFRESVSRSP